MIDENLSAKINIKVPFYDLDPMNIVWHGNYLKYMEEVRCEFFKNIKYTYEELYNDGVMYPIAKVDIKYIKSAYFGQDLEAHCTLLEVEPALIFKYKIIDANTKELICTAKTIQMGISTTTKETLFTISDKFRRKLEEYEN